MGGGDSKPAEKQPVLPVQDGTIPEFMASIHKWWYSTPVIGDGTDLTKMNRVKPGDLIMKKPNSVIELYN